MPSSNLARWGGLAAAVGGVLLVIWGFLLILIFSPMGVLGPLYGLFMALWCLSWLLVLEVWWGYTLARRTSTVDWERRASR